MNVNRPSLDWNIELFRGLAALMVVYAHYHTIVEIPPNLLSFFVTGVDLFFVLSGFVFAPYLFGGGFNFFPYLIRRFFRIYPLYVAALLVYVAIRLWGGHDTPYIGSHLLFMQTLRSFEESFYYNPAFWSLPPEVEFYLLLPLLSLIALKRRYLVLLCVVSIGTLFTTAHLSPPVAYQVNPWLIANRHMPGLLSEFLVGALVWLAIYRRPPASLFFRVLSGLIGISLWLVLATVFLEMGEQGVAQSDVYRGKLGFYAAVAYGFLLYALLGSVISPPRWLKTGALFLGSLSYPVYLFHNAAPQVVQKLGLEISGLTLGVVCVVTTVLLAAILHALIEAPMRSFGRRLADRFTPPLAQSRRRST